MPVTRRKGRIEDNADGAGKDEGGETSTPEIHVNGDENSNTSMLQSLKQKLSAPVLEAHNQRLAKGSQGKSGSGTSTSDMFRDKVNSFLLSAGIRSSPAPSIADQEETELHNKIEEIRQSSGVADVLPSEGVPRRQRVKIPFIQMPAHAARHSMLSSSSGYNNYRGLYNLAIIILFAFAARTTYENIHKYGILVTPMAWGSMLVTVDLAYLGLILLLLNVFLLLTFAIEKAASLMKISNSVANGLHIVVATISFAGPLAICIYLDMMALHSFIALVYVCIVWMKIISYFQVNKHYRQHPRLHARTSKIRIFARQNRRESMYDSAPTSAQISSGEASPQPTKRSEGAVDSSVREKYSEMMHEYSQRHLPPNTDDNASDRASHGSGTEGAQVANAQNLEVLGAHVSVPETLPVEHTKYPENITLSDMYYFLAAPTLCYELNYPRNVGVRWHFVFRRFAEAVVLLALLIIISQQWIAPTVANTFNHSEPITLPYLISRTLKLSVPNNILWLTLFYWYFHSVLNIAGELLRFADRQFYRDWWNSTTLSYFWKNWNIPVHKWCVRHVYKPLIGQGCSKLTAQLAVFVLSAVLHEVLVSVPLGLFKGWAFLAMVAQVPLVLFTSKYLSGTVWGNVVMWSSLFFGQPMAVMLYVQAFLAEHHTTTSTMPPAA